MKAVADDYEPRTMAELCQNALELLRDTEHGPIRCGYIGGELFKDAPHHRGSAPFARLAGKVMKRLEKAGLSDWKYEAGVSGWSVTLRGRRCDYRE